MAALFNRIIPILFVSDLEAERDFYVRLGFQVTYEGPEYPEFLALGHGSVEFGIERKPGFRTDSPDHVLTWQFGVGDIAAARSRLTAAGWRVLDNAALSAAGVTLRLEPCRSATAQGC